MNNDAYEQEISNQFDNSSHIIDLAVNDLINALKELFAKYNKRIQKNNGTNNHHHLTEQEKLYIKGIALAAGIALTFVPTAGPVLGPSVSAVVPVVIEAIINLYHKDLNKKIDNAWLVQNYLGTNSNAFFQQVAFQLINNNRNAIGSLSQGKWATKRITADLATNVMAAIKQDQGVNTSLANKIQSINEKVNNAIDEKKSLSKKASHQTFFKKK